MKIPHIHRSPVRLGILVCSALALVSWSPTPAGDNILMNSGSIHLSQGVLAIKDGTSAVNSIPSPALPAAIIGRNNRLDATAETGGIPAATLGRGLVVGTGNKFGTTSGASQTYAVAFGENNTSSMRSSLIVGLANIATKGATHVDQSLSFSGVFGESNTAHNARSSLMVGASNTLGVTDLNTRSFHSAVIGQLNSVTSTYGWAVGYENSVSADRGVAIGSGALADTANGTALGKYNAPMAAGDVLVIGNGTSVNARSTALRVTADGGVILGNSASGSVVLAKPQGDISMGEYQ